MAKIKKTTMKKLIPKKAGKALDEIQKEATPISRSPVPTKKIDMLTFADAVREVLNGKRLTRIAWNDVQTFILLKGEFLTIHIGGKYHQLIVSVGDMEGLDWYVLPQSN